MIQFFKENLNIYFVSEFDLWFSAKMLKSTKIALVVAALAGCRSLNIPAHQTAF
jgi:hypothetical protein